MATKKIKTKSKGKKGKVIKPTIFPVGSKEFMDEIVSDFKKSFGDDIFAKTTEAIRSNIRFWLPSGFALLDQAISGRGYPGGRVIEIIGKDATGKSTLGIMAAVEMQKAGGTVVVIDPEEVFDINRAHRMGLNTEERFFYYNGPKTIEHYTMLMMGICSHAKKAEQVPKILFLVDSIGGSTTISESERDMVEEGAARADMARKLHEAKRRSNIGGTGIIFMFINQITSNMASYGSQEATFGGRATKYWATVRLKIEMIEKLNDVNKIARGIKVNVDIDKNKVDRPFRSTEFWISFEDGVDELYSIINYLKAYTTLLGTAQGWIKWGEQSYQGIQNFYNYMINAPQEEYDALIDLAVNHYRSTM